MKLLNYIAGGATRLGVKTDAGVIDGAAVCAVAGLPAFATTDALIASKSLDAFRKAVPAAQAKGGLLDESKLVFAPCVSAPEKIVCVGFNYRRHAAETNTPIPEHPVLFGKFNNALAGHRATVTLPMKYASWFDYEAELVIVIGREMRDVAQKDALDHVFGYCTGNDLSARELQRRTSQFLLGKNPDGFAPIGPYLVTADEAGDPDALDIACWVNGEQRQNSNTSDMIFKCAETLSYTSRYMTLKPGDLLFMGTPEGVIWGHPEGKRVWLKPGDRVTTEIQRLGRQEVVLA